MPTREEAAAAADAAIAAAGVAKAFIAAADPTSPPPPASWPSPIDCLAGTAPTGVPAYAPNDGGYWGSRRVCLGRQQNNVPSGAWVFLGDSITESMAVQAVTQFAWNGGIAGDQTLGLVNRLGGTTCLRRAAGVVLLIGVNDCLDKARWWNPNLCMQQILAWLTGPLVLIYPWRVDPAQMDPDVVPYANGNIDFVNAQTAQLLAGRQRCATIDGNALLSAPGASGFLKAEYCAGGPHLSTVGYNRLIPEIQAKIALVTAA